MSNIAPQGSNSHATFYQRYLIPKESKNIRYALQKAKECGGSDNLLCAHVLSVSCTIGAVAMSFFNMLSYLLRSPFRLLGNVVQFSPLRSLTDFAADLRDTCRSALFVPVGISLAVAGFCFPGAIFTCFAPEFDENIEEGLRETIDDLQEKKRGIQHLMGAQYDCKSREAQDLKEQVFVLKSWTEVLEGKKDVNATIQGEGVKKCTLLHLACKRRQEEFMRTLVEKGADLFLKDADGQTPLDILPSAWEDYDKNKLKSLMEEFSDLQNSQRRTAEEQYLAATDRDGLSWHDFTPSKLSSHVLMLESWTEVLEGKKDVNTTIQGEGVKKCTLLHLACKRKQKELVGALVEKGADLFLEDAGQTPLDIIRAWGDYDNKKLKNLIEEFSYQQHLQYLEADKRYRDATNTERLSWKDFTLSKVSLDSEPLQVKSSIENIKESVFSYLADLRLAPRVL